MKTKLFFFSGTGNSLKVARDLAAELGDTEIVAIPEALKKQGSIDADRIGIVFPVYMWGLPLIVADFCSRLVAPSSAYIFGIATCGSSAGASLTQMKRLLDERNLTLSAGFVIVMPGNYTPLYGAPPVKKQEKMFAGATQRVSQIAGIVKAGTPARIEAGNFVWNLLASGLIYRLGSARIPQMDTRFRATEKCNSCGICEKVCPVGNIEMRSGRPAWLHKCEQCFACLQWCPQEAIQWGATTEGRKRYHHPVIAVKDLIIER
jgi:NAD-dependent dihydropyrimidine dehydrogenase PreA subunit